MSGALRKTTDAPSSHDDASRRGRGCASMGHQRPASGKGHSGVDRHVQGEDGSPSTHAAERTGLRDDPLAAERVPGDRAGGAPDDHVRDYAGAVRAVPATRKRHLEKAREVIPNADALWHSAIKPAGSHPATLKAKINMSGSRRCRFVDENDQPIDPPTAWRGRPVLPIVAVRGLYIQKTMVGLMLDVVALMVGSGAAQEAEYDFGA